MTGVELFFVQPRVNPALGFESLIEFPHGGFIVGGVAEERTTIYSDIDLLIILRGGGLKEKKKLYRKILERAIDVYGLPWDAPVELHIVDEREAEEYLKLSKKIVKIIPERLQNYYQPSKRT